MPSPLGWDCFVDGKYERVNTIDSKYVSRAIHQFAVLTRIGADTQTNNPKAIVHAACDIPNHNKLAAESIIGKSTLAM
jgi:hypothetical protein